MTTYHPDETMASQTGGEEKASDKGIAQHLRERVEEQSDALKERGQEARDQVSVTARQLSADGATFVRENPGLALAGALGVGLLVGLSVRSRY